MENLSHIDGAAVFSTHMQRVTHLLSCGRLPQVLLVSAATADLARQFALQLTRRSYCHSWTMCGHCQQCMAMSRKSASLTALDDILEIDSDGGPIKIEDAHRLSEHLALYPLSQWRTAVVYNADLLTVQAANALLKVLEELPAGARVILTTTKPNAILSTIWSRSIHWPLKIQLSGEGGTPSESEHRLLLALFKGGSEASSAAEELGRMKVRTAAELLDQFELFLNQSYKTGLAQPPTLSWPVVYRRRQELRRLRKMAIFAKINVNLQMLSEAVSPVTYPFSC